MSKNREGNCFSYFFRSTTFEARHSGLVRFDPNNTGGTRVSVQMDYIPPAGVVGHAVAKLFGVDPRQAMNEDLMRLKTLLEKTSSSGGADEYSNEVSVD